MSPQVQAMFFFAGCTIVGLLTAFFTLTGVLTDPVVGVLGGVGAVLGIYMLVKGATFIRASGRGNGER